MLLYRLADFLNRLFTDLFIYFREEERERAEGEEERENPKQIPWLSMEPNMELNLTTLRSRPEPKPRVGRSTD